MTQEMRVRLVASLDLPEQERADLIAKANAEGSTFEEIASVLELAVELSKSA